MKFKNYKKNYEDVFSSERFLSGCKPERVSIFGDMNIDKYIKLFKEEMGGLEKELFDRLVKICWLFKQFQYGDYRRKNLGRNNRYIDKAFAIFMRYYVGHESRTVWPYRKVMYYMEDFFPNFLLGDPFKQEHKYPYKYMTFADLTLVYQMPERMELLKYGEAKKMQRVDFIDYIINYIMCYGEEHDRINTKKPTYIFQQSLRGSVTNFLPYIRYKKYDIYGN